MFREYAAWIGDGCFWVRDFEDELAALPGYYQALLVARDDAGALIGSAAVKHLPDGAAELKRLYVRPAARGTGLGKRLAAAAIDRARELGYTIDPPRHAAEDGSRPRDLRLARVQAVRAVRRASHRRCSLLRTEPLTDTGSIKREGQ